MSCTRRSILVRGRLAALSVILAAGLGCGETPGIAAPAPNALLGPPVLAGSPHLLECDAPAAAITVSSVIGPLGGALVIGNTRVVIPANAVLVLTSFRLTIPASRLIEISVKAGDAEHFLFEQPVLVSIDYGRCADALPPLRSLSAWHIDETSKSLLDNMGGVDLRPFHTITFFTGHLSGYAVAD